MQESSSTRRLAQVYGWYKFLERVSPALLILCRLCVEISWPFEAVYLPMSGYHKLQCISELANHESVFKPRANRKQECIVMNGCSWASQWHWMFYIVALCLHLTMLLVMYFWFPSEQTLHVFFIVVIVRGIGDGLLLNQTTSK